MGYHSNGIGLRLEKTRFSYAFLAVKWRKKVLIHMYYFLCFVSFPDRGDSSPTVENQVISDVRPGFLKRYVLIC